MSEPDWDKTTDLRYQEHQEQYWAQMQEAREEAARVREDDECDCDECRASSDPPRKISST